MAMCTQERHPTLQSFIAYFSFSYISTVSPKYSPLHCKHRGINSVPSTCLVLHIVGDHKDGMGPPSAKIQVHGGHPLICTSYYDACDNIISRNAIMVMMRGRLRAYDNRICTRKIITAIVSR